MSFWRRFLRRLRRQGPDPGPGTAYTVGSFGSTFEQRRDGTILVNGVEVTEDNAHEYPFVDLSPSC